MPVTHTESSNVESVQLSRVKEVHESVCHLKSVAELREEVASSRHIGM